jgi:hypothetical protein
LKESFGMSLEGECHEAGVTPNLKLLFTFGMSLERDCPELYTQVHHKLRPNLEVTKISLKKSSLLIRFEKIMSLD